MRLLGIQPLAGASRAPLRDDHAPAQHADHQHEEADPRQQERDAHHHREERDLLGEKARDIFRCKGMLCIKVGGWVDPGSTGG